MAAPSYQTGPAVLQELPPLRRHRAEAVLRYIGPHRKHVMTGRLYEIITREMGIPPWAVDAAIDDLWGLGLVEVRVVGGVPVVAPIGQEVRR